MGGKKQASDHSKPNYSSHYADGEWDKLLNSVIAEEEGDGGEEGGGDEGGSGGFTHWRHELSETTSEQLSENKDLELTLEAQDAEQTNNEDTKHKAKKSEKSSWKKSNSEGTGKSSQNRQSAVGFHASHAAKVGTIVHQANLSGIQGSAQTNIAVSYNHTGQTKQSGGHAGRLFANPMDKNMAKLQNARANAASTQSSRLGMSSSRGRRG